MIQSLNKKCLNKIINNMYYGKDTAKKVTE